MDSDGHGPTVRIVASVYDSLAYDPWSWSADGKSVLATSSNPRTGELTLTAISADGSAPPRRLDLGPGHLFGPVSSPDGRYIAWASDVTGRSELYVAEAGNPGKVGIPVRVSSSGVIGGPSVVSRFGFRGQGQVFFIDLQNRLMVSTLTERPSLAASPSVSVADLRALRIDPLRIAVLPDGRIMAIQNGDDEGNVSSYNVITNWSDVLRSKMAAH
jgi:hypothetical protein